MAYVAVNNDEAEYVFEWCPFRSKYGEYWDADRNDAVVELPKGSIAKLIGRELTWSDEPVELKQHELLRYRNRNGTTSHVC